MKRFDHTKFPLPAKGLSPVPNHGVAWKHKYANWWGGATIASPTRDIAYMAKQSVDAVRRLALEGGDKLSEYYVQQTEWARHWVRKVLDLPESAPVLLDASGTSAILLASRMLAHIATAHGAKRFFTVTTDEGGSLIPATLKGRNPNTIDKVMFQPTSSLYYEPDVVLPYPAGLGIESAIVGLARLDNKQLVVALGETCQQMLENGHSHGVIVLPHVSKTGRILPVREVNAMAKEFRRRGLTVYMVVDDVQGFTRTDAETISDPLSYSDAYLFGSSKALGGLLIASAVAMKEDLVEEFVALAQAGKVLCDEPCISHFQFEPRYEERLADELLKDGAISIPEVVAMSSALHFHYFRGEGDTYSMRRQSQLRLVHSQREELVKALLTVPGLEVLEPSKNRPMVPSIVTFRVRGISPGALKKALQEGSPIITPSAPIGHYLRLDIPEYRGMPSKDVLVARLKQIVQGQDSL
jgi:selenocysteine lyase/cysteine desulfurase